MIYTDGFGGIFKTILSALNGTNKTKCKLNNTELFLKLFHIQSKEIGTTSTTKKQKNLKNGKMRFRLNIPNVRKEMEDPRLNAIKQLITFVITCRAKLLNADWLRQRACFLNQEGTFGIKRV